MPRPADPAPAIAAKKAQAAANRERLAEAIRALQHRNLPVNVQSVARTAGVHPDTLRRNPDLYAEVRRLREQGWRLAPASAPSKDQTNYRARMLAARDEVQDLRRELAVARVSAHQALGLATATLTTEAAAELRATNAELTVQVADLQDQVRALRAERRDVGEELIAAHELNREYVRELDSARKRLTQAERDPATARSKRDR